jgi:hypothetical protein
MIVRDFHIKGVTFPPIEAYTPSIVDADTVLPSSITSQRLQPVAGRNSQVFKPHGGMKHQQLAPGYAFD